jgi:hypothetical protein
MCIRKETVETAEKGHKFPEFLEIITVNTAMI